MNEKKIFCFAKTLDFLSNEEKRCIGVCGPFRRSIQAFHVMSDAGRSLQLLNEHIGYPSVTHEEKLKLLAERQEWSRQMRLLFSPKDMILPNGDINTDYFKPKQNTVVVRKWNANERKNLIEGIHKYGIGNWTKIKEEFLPAWEISEIRVKTQRLMGRQSLVEYIESNWKGDETIIGFEYNRNKQIGLSLNQWKGGVLVNDEAGLIKQKLETEPLDPEYKQYLEKVKKQQESNQSSNQSTEQSNANNHNIHINHNINNNIANHITHNSSLTRNEINQMNSKSTQTPLAHNNLSYSGVVGKRVYVWFEDVQQYYGGLVLNVIDNYAEKFSIRWDGSDQATSSNYDTNFDEVELPKKDCTTDESNDSRWCFEEQLFPFEAPPINQTFKHQSDSYNTNIYSSDSNAQSARLDNYHQKHRPMKAHFGSGTLAQHELPMTSPISISPSSSHSKEAQNNSNKKSLKVERIKSTKKKVSQKSNEEDEMWP